MSTETEITLVEESEVELYSKSGSLKPLIEKIRKEVLSIAPDVTTARGRDEIASLAYKVARSKTKVDEIEKKRGEKARLELERINSERKIWRDEMDKLKDEVRKPLTDYEEREKNRIRKHQEACAEIEAMKMLRPWCSQEAKEFVDKLTAITVDESYEEYRNKAEQAKADSLAYLQNEYTKLKKQEDDAAELEKLRKAEEERKRKEREDQIAKDAADKARKDAEEAAAKAEKARQAAEAKKQADEQAKRDAEAARIAKENADKIKAAEDKAAQAKRDADAEIERVQKEKDAADKAHKAEIEKVRQQASGKEVAAAYRSGSSVAFRGSSSATPAEKKEAARLDKSYHERLRGEAIGGLVKNKALISGEQAADIIQAIIDGEIPHVTFNF